MHQHRKISMTATAQHGAPPYWTALAVAAAVLIGAPALAQNYPITPGQRSTAEQVAQAGVPLSELAPDAPEEYTVKRGDTLWAISRMYLKSPWRWPELWGMNLEDIRNPHLIFPGQVLFLDTSDGTARLSTRRPGDGGTPTVRVSPRVRSESLSDSAIPPISLQAIESFLAEPIIVDEGTFSRAPRIVSATDSRVLMSMGDRAYARALYGSSEAGDAEPLSIGEGKPRNFRVFRNAGHGITDHGHEHQVRPGRGLRRSPRLPRLRVRPRGLRARGSAVRRRPGATASSRGSRRARSPRWRRCRCNRTRPACPSSSTAWSVERRRPG